MKAYFEKRVLCALFSLLLYSCCPRIPSWYVESQCYGTAYHYTKLIYSEANSCKNLELMIIRTSQNLMMYINVLSIPIEECLGPDDMDLVKCKVVLTGTETLEFPVTRLDGNQRFLIAEEIRDRILDHLWAEGTLTIYLGRYKGEITPYNFRSSYRSLLF